MIEKITSMSKATWQKYFSSHQAVNHWFWRFLFEIFFQSCILGNVQNERAAILTRGCSKGIGDAAPTSRWANRENRDLFALLATLWTDKISVKLISQSGMISLCYLWSIRLQVDAHFFNFWTCAQVGNKWFRSIELLANLARSYLVPSWRIVRKDNFQIGLLLNLHWSHSYFPTTCREVVLSLQTNLVQSDRFKIKEFHSDLKQCFFIM